MRQFSERIAGDAVGQAVYDGGGASSALQVDATAADLVAGGAEVLHRAGSDVLDVWLMNTTAGQGGTLVVAEFSAATPTVATMIRSTEVTIPAAEQTGTVDQAAFGLTTGTEKNAKDPLRVAVTPGSYILIALAAADGGTFYARVAFLR